MMLFHFKKRALSVEGSRNRKVKTEIGFGRVFTIPVLKFFSNPSMLNLRCRLFDHESAGLVLPVDWAWLAESVFPNPNVVPLLPA